MIKKLLLFSLIFLLSFQVTTDSDLGWLIRLGEHITTTKSIPKTDIFSFSQPNYPYVYHSWGSAVLMFAAYSVLGLTGISLLFALIQTVSIAILAQASKMTFTKISFLFLPLMALLAYPIAGGRTRIFGFLFFCALYLLYTKSQGAKSKAIWLAPLIFIPWANLHGSFIVGIGFLASLTTATLFFGGKNRKFEKFRQQIIILLLSMAATLINPYGIRAWTGAISISLGSTTSLRDINYDWAGLISPDTTGWIFALLAAGTIMASFLVKTSLDKIHKALLLLFFALSLVTSRFVIPLLVLVIPSAAKLTQKLTEKLPKNKHSFSMNDFSFLPVKTSSFAVTLILPLLALVNVLEVKSAHQSLGKYSEYLQDKAPPKIRQISWSYQGNLFIDQNLKGTRILNDANWGGLMLLVNPETKVFYYGAMDNYYVDGQSFVFEYLNTIAAGSDFEKTLAKYQIEAVFLPKKYQLVTALKNKQDWHTVYEDEKSVALVKR